MEVVARSDADVEVAALQIFVEEGAQNRLRRAAPYPDVGDVQNPEVVEEQDQRILDGGARGARPIGHHDERGLQRFAERIWARSMQPDELSGYIPWAHASNRYARIVS